MTFIEGFLSFVSPCILPMVPVYLIYMSGENRSPVVNSLGFSLGFSTVFILLGVCAGSIGSALAAHRTTVNLVCAAVIALLGLGFVFNIPLPLKGMGGGAVRPAGFFKAVVFGMVFSVALTPCVGAFLGAALMTAASEGGALKGALLLAEYSAGMAIPFILSAVMINRLKGAFGFFKTHARGVSVVSGVLLLGFAGCTAAKVVLPSPAADASTETQTREETEMEITLNAANFEAEVLKSDKPVIVDFWATWCGPCRMLAPELEALAREKGDQIKVGKVNVDENPELCAKYGIMSIPAIFVFKNGRISAQSVGFQRKDELAALLEQQ